MRPLKGDERWQLHMGLTNDCADENGNWQPVMRNSYGSSVSVNASAEWYAQVEDESMVTHALMQRLRAEAHRLVDDLFSGKLHERGDT